jgi:2-dehydro-3-deoxyphosphogluconate aldolase / (4S)-4-hydroxy-2-oxoglutarate aldolase
MSTKQFSPNFPPHLTRSIYASGIIAVVTVDRPEDAVALGEVLLEGGIDTIELTLRTPNALSCISAMTEWSADLTVGAGTVLTPEQLIEARDAGASFAVAPGLNPAVVECAAENAFPFAPGVSTPSEIEHAWRLGCNTLKYFPAGGLAGLTTLKLISAPYAHLGIQFIPLGGLNSTHVTDFLAEPSVLALGGSWLTPKDALQARDWDRIRQLASETAFIVKSLRPDA